ncbi:MAG: glycosyltransferase family 2 protein [Bacteroidota bacterium]
MTTASADSVPRIYVIIPAFNEEDSIGKVVSDIPEGLVHEVVVVSNGSTDLTETNASKAGAAVLREEQKGYGFACLRGLSYIAQKPQDQRPEIVVFIDGDYSDFPAEMPEVVQPIIEEGYDLVIGSRALGQREKGSMQPQQIFGNWLATSLIKLLYRVEFTDLGPFRAVAYDKLLEIDMQDTTFGWTVEMQVKAAKMKMRCKEVPVNYRRRIGVSKITGTIKGTVLAGYKILWTIFKLL